MGGSDGWKANVVKLHAILVSLVFTAGEGLHGQNVLICTIDL